MVAAVKKKKGKTTTTKKSQSAVKNTKSKAQRNTKKDSISKPKISRKTNQPITIKQNREEEKELVQDCISMKMNEIKSLEYLKLNNAKMEAKKFYELKKELQEEKKQFLHKFAMDDGLEDSHISLIKSYRTIERKMWEEFRIEEKAINRATILMKITELHVYLTDAYDMTKEILLEQATLTEKLKTENIIPAV